MEKRVRSPNYPAMSLPDAIEKAGILYRNQHTHGAPREVVAKGMGYTGLNGASASAISALHKYGLLDRSGEDLRVSDRAMRILHPHSQEERGLAIREAAFLPPLFAELAERFPGQLPGEELLRNYLVRKGFSAGAVPGVILAYRDTVDLVQREGSPYSPTGLGPHGEQDLPPPSQALVPVGQTSSSVQPALPARHVVLADSERLIGRYQLEGGAYVQIVASEDVPTEEALYWLEVLIANKRKELELRNARRAKEGQLDEEEDG